jgi:hypothetical protein
MVALQLILLQPVAMVAPELRVEAMEVLVLQEAQLVAVVAAVVGALFMFFGK